MVAKLWPSNTTIPANHTLRQSARHTHFRRFAASRRACWHTMGISKSDRAVSQCDKAAKTASTMISLQPPASGDCAGWQRERIHSPAQSWPEKDSKIIGNREARFPSKRFLNSSTVQNSTHITQRSPFLLPGHQSTQWRIYAGARACLFR